MSAPSPTPATAPALDRRSFIKVSALAGGGLLVGSYFALETSAAAQTTAGTLPAAATPAGAVAAAGEFAPNVFVSISPSGVVTLIAPNTEMGQGSKTALPMMIAEELDVAWDKVVVKQGDLNPAYGAQFSVGSGTTPSNYMPLRRAGATARAVLVEAAAQTWGVPAAECTTADSFVIHAASNRRLAYGELVAKAATLPAPANVALKDPATFKLLGTRVPGVDNEKIVTGQALYGIDVRLPGMVYAAYEKCPVFGGKIGGPANLDEIKQMPGVRDAFVLDGIAGLTPGVAIVADSTYHAFNAAGKLRIRWDAGAGEKQSSIDMADTAADLGKAGLTLTVPEGAKLIEATYHYPFLAHATLEPQNCTAVFKGGVMEMWCPTQIPSTGQRLVTQGLGLAAKDVIVHITRLGGGFGRRGNNEYSAEVAAIAKRFEGTPVKLTWTREQDFDHDVHRSNGWHYFQAALDGSGKVVGLQDSFVKMQGGPGDMGTGAFPVPFAAIPGSSVKVSKIPGTIPTGYWRAPGDNGNTWAMQCFLDELAHAAGREPLAFTLDLLAAIPPAAPGGGRGGRGGGGGFVASRMTDVLKLAAERAGWGKKLPRGEGQGFSITHTNNSYVAVFADVAVSKEGELTIKRLSAVVDAGQIINLSSAESQVQGSILDGISAAWLQKVTIEGGRADQRNFEDYQLLRMAACGKQVHRWVEVSIGRCPLLSPIPDLGFRCFQMPAP